MKARIEELYITLASNPENCGVEGGSLVVNKSQGGEVLRIGAVAGWALVTYLWIEWGLWYLFLIYFGIHLGEAFSIGLKKGKEAGYSSLDSFLYTFIFGFTWWHYLE